MALILVIDDDAFYRGVIRRILEDAGHEVVEAENGREGIDAYHDRRPQIVITDMLMPGLDGRGVIDSLHGEGSRVPIIALSGDGAFYNIDFATAARKLGVAAILRKLDSKEWVLSEIHNILGR